MTLALEDRFRLQDLMGGYPRLMIHMMPIVDRLELTGPQIRALCDAAPEGEELWSAFETRTAKPGTPEDYNLQDFIVEILAKTECPVAQP